MGGMGHQLNGDGGVELQQPHQGVEGHHRLGQQVETPEGIVDIVKFDGRIGGRQVEFKPEILAVFEPFGGDPGLVVEKTILESGKDILGALVQLDLELPTLGAHPQVGPVGADDPQGRPVDRCPRFLIENLSRSLENDRRDDK